MEAAAKASHGVSSVLVCTRTVSMFFSSRHRGGGRYRLNDFVPPACFGG